MAGYKHSGGYKRSIDLTGQRFFRLTVLEQSEPFRAKTGNIQCAGWRCKCDCGNEIIVRSNSLRTSKTKSCGCLNKEKEPNYVTHHMSNTRIYSIYKSIKRRCFNENSENYASYGGRGISVCNEWCDRENGFVNFYNWAMANGYSDELTIERIDVNGNYEPSNCTWIPNHEQAFNKRNTIYSKDGKSVAKMAREKGTVSPAIARERYKKGWELEDALNIPVLKKGETLEKRKKIN